MSKKHKKPARPAAPTPVEPAPSPSVPSAVSALPWKMALPLLAVALVLRFILLGRADLWQDEMLLIMTADAKLGMAEVIRNYWASQMVSLGWLPLPAVVQNVFMAFASEWAPDVMQNPFAARIPGVLLGVVGVAGVFALTRRSYSRFVALAATLIAAVTFYPVFYAREVHAYPLLLALAPWALHAYTRCLFDADAKRGAYIGLWVLCLLLVFTHLTAPMLVFAMAATAGVRWLALLKRADTTGASGRAVKTTIAVGLAGAAVIPVFMKVLGGDSPHLRQPSGTSPLFILNDLVAKLFLGDLPVPAVIGWIVVLLALYRILAMARRNPVAATHAVLLLFGGGLILLAALRTQYLSARYFAVITPLLMILIPVGFAATAHRIVGWFRRPSAEAAVGWGLVGIFVGIHLVLFLPPMYLLKNKSTDFGSIARWLNENLSPGTPYVMESAYELRFVSGFYPTPDLIPAAPYVHGNEASEIDRLWERQESFLRRFPEAPLVESAHHVNAAGERWAFPRAYFRRHVELRDDALRSLVRMGIYGTFFRKDLNDRSFVTWIHHNTPEDVRNVWRDEGRGMLPVYEGWQTAQLARGMYVRAAPGPGGQIRLENLAGVPLTGTVVVVGSVYTEAAGETFDATVRLGDRRFGPFKLRAGTFTSMTLDGVVIPPGGANAVIRIEATSARDKVRAILALDTTFASAADRDTPPRP